MPKQRSQKAGTVTAETAATPPRPATSTADPQPKPVHTIAYDTVRGRIWKDATGFTVTVDRCHRYHGGEQLSSAFFVRDLQELAKVSRECQRWIEWQERRLAAAPASE